MTFTKNHVEHAYASNMFLGGRLHGKPVPRDSFCVLLATRTAKYDDCHGHTDPGKHAIHQGSSSL